MLSFLIHLVAASSILSSIACQSRSDGPISAETPEVHTKSTAEVLGLPQINARNYNSAYILAWQQTGVGETKLREHLNMTTAENAIVPPKDPTLIRRISQCIDLEVIAMTENEYFGTETGSDLELLWAVEVLRCHL